MSTDLAPDVAVDTLDLLRALAPDGGVVTGIPCSHLGGIFETAQTARNWRLIVPTSEGEAIGIACGVIAMAGAAIVAMQNSGLGSALDPLVSLATPARLTIPLVVSHRGHSQVEALAQHAVMGAITHELLALAGIDSVALHGDGIPGVRELIESATARRESFAVVVRQGDLRATATPTPLTLAATTDSEVTSSPRVARSGSAPQRYRRRAVIEALQRARPDDTIAVATTGHTSREMYAVADSARNVYLSGSMGYASAFALGVNQQRPDLGVVAIDGDGSALMHLGALATVGAFGGGRFRHIVLDNRVHGSTGGQPTVSASVDFPALASAAGYRSSATCADIGSLTAAVEWLLAAPGPALLHVPTAAEAGTGLPRIPVGLDDQLARLVSWAAGRSR